MTAVSCSPLGFTRSPTEGTAELIWAAGRWNLLPPLPDRPADAATAQDPSRSAVPRPERAVARPLGPRVRAEEIDSLRPLRALRVGWPAAPPQAGGRPDGGAPEGGDAAAPLAPIIDLAAAGVPLTSDPAPDWVRRAEPVLSELLASWTPQPDDGSPRSLGDLRREEHSVRLRRYGLRAAGIGRAVPPVTVIMATRRPHLLSAALGQIARQRGVDLEVIVALHGYPAEAVEQAVREFPLPITVLQAAQETPLGEVLNMAAARAGADTVVKWDDDDWYGPEHVMDLLLAKAYSGADLVGTAQEFFYLEPLDVTIRRTDYGSEMWTDHVAGGTIMTDRRLLREVGGFGSASRGVDTHLQRAVLAGGGRIYRTHGLGYMLRRSVGGDHTWRLPLAHFLRVAKKQWRGFRPSVILEPQ